MLSEEVRRKVRLIEFTTRKMVDDALSGSYKSRFKGQGVQFSEHRLYMAGDDVRHIDWKVSARSRDPVIKKFEEERELNVLILVDVSGSKRFGSHAKLKSEVAAEIAGLLSYAAVHTGDKVGLLLFSEKVEKILPPKKGRSHIQRIINEVLSFEPKYQGTKLSLAFDSANRILKHSGVIFILSDFLDKDYEISLKRLAKKHDVTALTITDPREHNLPNVGSLTFWDAEAGAEVFVDTGSFRFRQWFEEMTKGRAQNFTASMKNSGVDQLTVSSHENYIDLVVKFFQKKLKRGNRR